MKVLEMLLGVKAPEVLEGKEMRRRELKMPLYIEPSRKILKMSLYIEPNRKILKMPFYKEMPRKVQVTSLARGILGRA